MPEILRLDGEKDWTRKKESMKMGIKRWGRERSAICFLRDRENKNESNAQRQNVSMSGVWEDSVCWSEGVVGGATRGTAR